MISVANDLLNNSLGLCWGTDGRPNIYTYVFTGRLVHTCALMHLFVHSYAYIQIFVDTHTHSRSPLHVSCCWHLGCFTSAPPRFPDSTIQPHSLSKHKKKLADNFISSRSLAIKTDFIQPYHYFSFYVSLWTFSVCVCILNTTVKPLHAALLFSNHRSLEAKVNCQGLTFTVTLIDLISCLKSTENSLWYCSQLPVCTTGSQIQRSLHIKACAHTHCGNVQVCMPVLSSVMLPVFSFHI